MSLTNTQVSKLHKAFGNNSLANIKLSKTQLHEIGQSGGFLDRLLGPLLQIGLPLMKNVLKPLAKSVLAKSVLIHKTNNTISKANNINNFEWRTEWYYENS